MIKLELLSERKVYDSQSMMCIYELEDSIAKTLNIEIVDMYKGALGRIKRLATRVKWRIRRKQGRLSATFKVDPNDTTWKIYFVQNASRFQWFSSISNGIPVFLDFYLADLENVANAVKDLPFFWVGSYDVYKRLKDIGCENVKYMATCIGDVWVTDTVHEKSIDVIQFGRRNVKLHEWMLEYCKRHKETEYVYVKNSQFEYFSTTRGNIGTFGTRDEFMNLISKAKVMLISTPGVEGDGRFGNTDFFPMRFFEGPAMDCFLIGRYSENKEAELYSIEDICPNVSTYDEFETYMNDYLKRDSKENKIRYKEFLKNNVASERAKLIKEAFAEMD